MIKLELRSLNKKALLVTAIAGLLSYSKICLAATIATTGHGKAIVKFDDSEKVQIGSKLDVLGSDGNSKGVVEVTFVKGHSARANIVNGVAIGGDRAKLQGEAASAAGAAAPPAESTPAPTATTTAAAATPEASPTPAPTPAPPVPRIIYKKLIGAISIDSETVQLTSSTQVTMSGVAPIIRYSYNGNIDDSGKTALKYFTWEAGAGAEELKTKGTLSSASCQGSSNCVFDIPSITAFGRLGWRPFEQHHGAPELRLGADLLFPVSVNSNVISYTAFTPLFFATIGIAARKRLSESSGLPYGIDFASYVGSSGTTFYRIMLYAGYAWH